MHDRSSAIISQSHWKADRTVWAYKIMAFLEGQITADELLALSTSTDQKTEAHTFIGMELLLRDKQVEARTHFEWVKQYGNPTFYEYPLALAELERGR